MIPFKKNNLNRVSDAEMVEIYNKIKTPIKRGAVMKWENDFTDSPTVFKKDGINYHFYCAVNDNNERFIALAMSE